MLAKLLSLGKRHWVSIRVIGSFGFLISAFFFVLSWGPIVDRVDIGAALARLSAWISAGILRAMAGPLDFDFHSFGTVMGSGDFEVDVAPACSGAVPTSIYLAAVLSFPSPWRSRLIGSVLGIVAIFVINLGRVVGLFLIGLFYPEVFHDTHVYIAQSLVVCFAVAMFLYWATNFTDAPAT